MVTRIWKLVIVGLVLTVLAAEMQSADKPQPTAADMERKAKAALALAATERPTPAATAPEPREASPLVPIVIYSGYDGPAVSGGAVMRDDKFPGAASPGVVVAYPASDRLAVEKKFTGKPEVSEIEKAVASARAKLGAKPMPASVADWQIRHEKQDCEAGAAHKKTAGCPCEVCCCVTSPGGVGTCGSYLCPANGGKKAEPKQSPTPAVIVHQPVLVGWEQQCMIVNGRRQCVWVPVYR